jgi:hypothetical protein
MKTALPRLYKTLLALALVSGPLIWLLFTPDGQRRTDLLLLPLLGRPSVELSMKDLSSRLTEEDVRARLPQAELQCRTGEMTFGDRACTARIGAFGRLPAEALAFFFSGSELRAAKLTYRRDVHGELLASLSRRLGEGELTKRTDTGGTGGVLTWHVSDGVVLLNAGDLGPRDEAALLWLSGVAMEERLKAARAGASAGH